MVMAPYYSKLPSNDMSILVIGINGSMVLSTGAVSKVDNGSLSLSTGIDASGVGSDYSSNGGGIRVAS